MAPIPRSLASKGSCVRHSERSCRQLSMDGTSKRLQLAHIQPPARLCALIITQDRAAYCQDYHSQNHRWDPSSTTGARTYTRCLQQGHRPHCLSRKLCTRFPLHEQIFDTLRSACYVQARILYRIVPRASAHEKSHQVVPRRGNHALK